MLTKLTICNFKLFDEVQIELEDRVVFAGLNNAGRDQAGSSRVHQEAWRDRDGFAHTGEHPA